MKLQSLVLSSDEKIMRVLRRVLSDLDIDVEHVTDAEAAIRRLTRERFEAVIVDCHREETAAHVLRSARSAVCNKRAVAVAIIEEKQAVRGAFDLGAHFVLYKPISMERAKASFRAARALMKCERRHNARIPVEIPVMLVFPDGKQQAVTSDFSEGGVAIVLKRQAKATGPLKIQFALPGMGHEIECAAEVAWQNAGRQTGVRFTDISPESRHHIKQWLAQQLPDFEAEDPPVPCKLTDLSLGGCYMEVEVPFPVRSRVTLTMKVPGAELQVEGIVRVAHSDLGMGVEFTRKTEEQVRHVEAFIQTLVNSGETAPELLVEPEGLEPFDPTDSDRAAGPSDDPLLGLFRSKADLTADQFHEALRSQRNPQASAASA
jgi:DNA-binding response OmpR family regulator